MVTEEGRGKCVGDDVDDGPQDDWIGWCEVSCCDYRRNLLRQEYIARVADRRFGGVWYPRERKRPLSADLQEYRHLLGGDGDLQMKKNGSE